jgi:hypothetical protein
MNYMSKYDTYNIKKHSNFPQKAPIRGLEGKIRKNPQELA